MRSARSMAVITFLAWGVIGSVAPAALSHARRAKDKLSRGV